MWIPVLMFRVHPLLELIIEDNAMYVRVYK